MNKQVYLEEGKTQTSQVLKNKFVSATWKKNNCKKYQKKKSTILTKNKLQRIAKK